MSTPSKRRRTSPSTYVTVNSFNRLNAPRSATTKRASYLSPTKASLARSNPDLLPKITDAQIRRESSPNRRQSLRDAVLGSRNEEARQNNSVDTVEVQRAGLGIKRAETANILPLNDALSRDPTKPSETPMRKNKLDSVTARSPLKMTQSSVYTPRHYRSIPTSKTPRIVPTLVPSTSKFENSSQEVQEPEGALPPTPVELGSDQRPNRPRGLASSSPGGAGRRRVRTQDGSVTSSPLKTRISLPNPSDTHDHVEIASWLGREEDDNSNDGSNSLNNNNRDETSINPQQETMEPLDLSSEGGIQTSADDDTTKDYTELKSLQDQLQALRAEFTDLEALDTVLSKFNAKSSDWTNLDTSLELLLSSTSKAFDPLHPPLEAHDLFQKNSANFLTLFSPGSLLMSYQTWGKKVKGSEKFVYETTFAAPNPWPLTTLNVTFETTFDLESDMIEHIRFKRVGDAPLSEELEKWIEAQTENPVVGCDLATVVTGVGRYFEADVARARVFKQLSLQYPLLDQILISVDDPSTLTSTQAHAQTAKSSNPHDEVLSLLPFLTKTQMTVGGSSGLSTRHKTRRSASSISAKEIMLVYEIKLNWIGNPSAHVSIVTSGFTDEASKQARKMFAEIESIKGVVSAFERVCEVLGISRSGEDGNEVKTSETKEMNKGRGRARKSTARRMTEFN